ncbi:MAG: secondary thiamine-phosphate synthase enzyme YjbQ [Fimbriimonadaceae bacterium]
MKSMVVTRQIRVDTRGPNDMVDLTGRLADAVRESGVAAGVAVLFVVGSTAALTTIEFEPGLEQDMAAAMERFAPEGAFYHHEARWGDDNGHSHVRASVVGPSLTVPIVDGRPTLGTWQQIVLLEFDTRPRERTVVVQLIG